jgi:hypothetical protein
VRTVDGSTKVKLLSERNSIMATVRLVLVNDPVDPEAIDVWVDGSVGHVPVRFMLDTGAARCTVPLLDSTRDLGVTGINSGVGASGTGLGEDEVVVPRLCLGDLVIEDVAATRSVAEPPLSTLLGMTALVRFRCEFRFSDRQLELDGSNSFDPGEWSELTSHVGAQPMVPVHFDTVGALACWDTGAGLTVVDLGFASAHPRLFEPVRATRGIDSSGVEMPSQLCRMAACRVGGIAIEPSACALVDLSALNATLEEPISFVLGMPAIVQADWSFDFPRRRWSVRRA